MPKKCTKTKNLHVQSCCFANLNLFLVWRSRCRRSRRLCLSFLVILSKFASCMTPARIAQRSLVLLWSYIFYWFGSHSSQPNSKAGRGETKQQPQTWPACFTGRFRHRWISKAEVPLGRPFFNLLPTTVARGGGGGGGGWGGGLGPLPYYFKTAHSPATKSAHNNVLIISHHSHIAKCIDRNHISLK